MIIGSYYPVGDSIDSFQTSLSCNSPNPQGFVLFSDIYDANHDELVSGTKQNLIIDYHNTDLRGDEQYCYSSFNRDVLHCIGEGNVVCPFVVRDSTFFRKGLLAPPTEETVFGFRKQVEEAPLRVAKDVSIGICIKSTDIEFITWVLSTFNKKQYIMVIADVVTAYFVKQLYKLGVTHLFTSEWKPWFSNVSTFLTPRQSEFNEVIAKLGITVEPVIQSYVMQNKLGAALENAVTGSVGNRKGLVQRFVGGVVVCYLSEDGVPMAPINHLDHY